MNRVSLLCLLCQPFWALSQFTYETLERKSPLLVTVDLSSVEPEYDPKLTLIKKNHPQPAGNFETLKNQLDAERQKRNQNSYAATSSLGKKSVPLPVSLGGFKANITQGTPNDNDLAVSNANTVVSVVNTNVQVYNDSGKFIAGKTLASIARHFITKKDTAALNRTYDPRVIYDPENDRFILVFLQGSSSADTRIIVGFTQTNDPSKIWNFYVVPGNVTADSSWSDYPIIALSKHELFITVNRLKDNTFWKNGFIESYVWQMDKAKGYAGDSMSQKLYFNIKHNGSPIWSICPAKSGTIPKSSDMYLFSVRPDQLTNDTIFVHRITNTIASGTSTMSMQILKADRQYGLQPNAIQPNGKKLQTNDARVLSAMQENGIFYLVGNCIDTTSFSPGFYLMTIEGLWGGTQKTHLQVFASDTMDFGYPSIAYCGGGYGDNSAIITFSHVSPRSWPGTSVAYVDRNLNLSPPAIMKSGEGIIQLIGDSVERWGDYTGIQPKYNQNGIVFFNGSFGYNNDNRTWVGKARNPDPRMSTSENLAIPQLHSYPVPASEYLSIEFEMKQTALVDINLYDLSGNVIPLLRDKAKAGLNRFSFSVSDLPEGVYFLTIRNNEQLYFSKKIVVAH